MGKRRFSIGAIALATILSACGGRTATKPATATTSNIPPTTQAPATTTTTQPTVLTEEQVRAQVLRNADWPELGTANIQTHFTIDISGIKTEVLSYVTSHMISQQAATEQTAYFADLARTGLKLSANIPPHGAVSVTLTPKAQSSSTIVVIPPGVKVPTWADTFFSASSGSTGATFLRNGQRVEIIRVEPGFNLNGIWSVERCQSEIEALPDAAANSDTSINMKLAVQELTCNVLGQKARGRQSGLSESQVDQNLAKLTIRTPDFPNGFPALPLSEIPFSGIPNTPIVSLIP